MKKRLLSLALLVCMLLATACTGTADPVDTNDASVDTSAVSSADEESTEKPDVPDDLYYDGRSFRILCTLDAWYGPADLDEFELDKSADVLSQAHYKRNTMIEERFGIDLEIYYTAEQTVDDVAIASVSAMSDDYDLVADVADWHRGAVYEGIYMPVNDLPYVDLDKPWWNKAYIESVSVNPANPYILFGPINGNGLQRTICGFFNIDLLTKTHGMTEQDMYDLVLDGEWTIDKMIEMCKGIYSDENGNTKPDDQDIYGFSHWNYWQVNFMAHSSGLKFTERDEDGYPVLALNNERSIALADKLLTLFNNEDTYNHADNHGAVDFFATGHSLFHINRFFISEWNEMRENPNINYGIIPAPKFDESIDNYYSAVANNGQWQMVPITEPDPEFASAIIEYLAYYGQEYIIPAYYDISLKFKYVRGDVDGASKMLDLITSNMYTDFIGVNTVGGLENIFTEICRQGQNNFSSKYAMRESGANYRLKEYIQTLG